MNEMHGHFWAAFGWVAFALNVWGNVELGTKSIRGWLIRIVCNVCWLPYGLATGALAITANHALFALINVWGWRRWIRDAHRACPAGECPRCERKNIAKWVRDTRDTKGRA